MLLVESELFVELLSDEFLLVLDFLGGVVTAIFFNVFFIDFVPSAFMIVSVISSWFSFGA